VFSVAINVLNMYSLEMPFGILNCVAHIKCFVLRAMRLLALIVSNFTREVTHTHTHTHTVNISQFTFIAIHFSLPTAICTRALSHCSYVYVYSLIVYYLLHLGVFILCHILHTRLLIKYTYCFTFYVHIQSNAVITLWQELNILCRCIRVLL
jgi:hypothetical protein